VPFLIAPTSLASLSSARTANFIEKSGGTAFALTSMEP
jgi:hypothetical protein